MKQKEKSNKENLFRFGAAAWPHGRSQDYFGGEHLIENFQKNLTNHALVFRAFGRKTQIVGNFENIFEIFEKIAKMHYFSIFFKTT